MASTTSFLVFLIPLFLIPFSSACLHTEREALLRFKHALNHSTHFSFYSTDLRSWEKGGDCCLWDGISCHNTTTRVVAVEIHHGDFEMEDGGVISESLCNLTSLSTISLHYMGLTGTLPPCLGNLSSLSVLDLYGINFQGENVLPTLCKLSNLRVVNLSYNYQLNGSLPSCLGSLSSLTELRLSGNSLSGNIPSSPSLAVLDLYFNNFQEETVLPTLCKLGNLSYVDLSRNQLNGSLPTCPSSLSMTPYSLGKMSSLKYFDVSMNSLSGSIPDSLGNLSLLSNLGLSDNQLTGSIPDSLGNLSLLSRLGLSDNQLTGSIPDSLGNLSLLEYLDLSDNQLTGSIPDSLGNLSLLEYLVVSDNQLNGTLPSSFSRLSSLTHLFTDGNAFSLSVASFALPSSLQSLYLSLDGQQAISEAFFYNLTKLKNLALYNCVRNIGTTWSPSFQLAWLSMISCKVDGGVPLWISTQFSLKLLKLVDNNLIGEIPSWLLNMNIPFVNLTTNHLQGQLLLNTSDANPLRALDVSRNMLSGQIPSIWPSNIAILLLNDNLLTGNIPPNIQGFSSLRLQTSQITI